MSATVLFSLILQKIKLLTRINCKDKLKPNGLPVGKMNIHLIKIKFMMFLYYCRIELSMFWDIHVEPAALIRVQD